MRRASLCALFLIVFNVAVRGQSVAPYFFTPDSLLTNRSEPANFQGTHILDSSNLMCTYWTSLIGYSQDTADVSFKIVGDNANSYALAPPVRVNENGGYFWMRFSGAPKYHIHDTLVSTYVGQFGTIITRNPIEAYTAYRFSHSIDPVSQIVAPFLGQTSANVMIRNIIDVPLSLSNLYFAGKDSLSFFVTGPSSISPHDSAAFQITLKDNDQNKDCDYNSRAATLFGNVRPMTSNDLPCLDSNLSVGLNGMIDVYSPDYPSYVPDLRHGLHPAGIIFRVYDPPFNIIFNNSDSTTRLFYSPYYEDSHFQLSVTGWNFPDTIRSHTDWMITQTSYTNDTQNHSRLTRLRWPRDIDTISIDVLALGADWVESVQKNTPFTVLQMWPSPASTAIHILSNDENELHALIEDALGRIVRTVIIPSSSSTISISDLPNGSYELVIASLNRAYKFDIVH